MSDQTFKTLVKTVFEALDFDTDALDASLEAEFLLKTHAEQAGYRCFNDEAAYFVGALYALSDNTREARKTEALAIIVARIVFNTRHTNQPLINADQMPGMTLDDALNIGLVAGRMLGRLKAI
jgi:predicted chitinase